MRKYKHYYIEQEVFYVERDDKTRMVDQEETKREFESQLEEAIDQIDTYKCVICKRVKQWTDFDNESSEAYMDGEFKNCICDDCSEKLELKAQKLENKKSKITGK